MHINHHGGLFFSNEYHLQRKLQADCASCEQSLLIPVIIVIRQWLIMSYQFCLQQSGEGKQRLYMEFITKKPRN